MTATELSKLIKETTKIGNKFGHRSEEGKKALMLQKKAKKEFMEENGEQALLDVIFPKKGGFKLKNSKGYGQYGV